MKRDSLIKKFKERAKHTEKLREDPRYKNVIGFFVQMGFLNSNEKFPRLGNRRLSLRDAVWVGLEIEPRVLEVLPAAFARLPKRFTYNPEEVKDIKLVIESLRNDDEFGPNFLGVPFTKLKSWYNLRLLDGRTKTPKEKKISRNFRFRPEVIEKLSKRMKAKKMTATDLIESLILGK